MFPETFDLELIKLVRENPVLYDVNHAKYMDFNSREVAWQRIGDELKKPAADCKVRWINIRDVYRRILKKKFLTGKSLRKYKYENELTFLKPHYRDVVLAEYAEREDEWNDSHDNEPLRNNDNDESYHSGDSEGEKKVLKPKKRRKSKKKHETFVDVEVKPSGSSFDNSNHDLDPSDAVDAFLISIGATLKTFSPYHLNLAKSKIFAVVQEHDLQQIVQKESGDTKISTSESMFLHE